MRLRGISAAHERLLEQLATGISGRLEARFVNLPDRDEANVGVELSEQQRKVVIAMPVALVAQAMDEPGARELLRTRVKARRDRMIFRTPPAPLPKKITPLFNVGPPRGGFRGGRR